MLTPAQFAAANQLVPAVAPVVSTPNGSIIYTPTQPERWDLISAKFYGDPTLYVGIILANPTIPISGVVPAGTVLYIPFINPPSGNASYPTTPWGAVA